MSESHDSQFADSAPGWAEAPGLGRALTVGVAVGVAVSFLGVGGAFLAAGQGWGASAAMGAFVALWGGLGFGAMIGGVVWATDFGDTAPEASATAAEALEPAGRSSKTVTTIGGDGVRADGASAATVKVAS